jgi:hypothetical protein
VVSVLGLNPATYSEIISCIVREFVKH